MIRCIANTKKKEKRFNKLLHLLSNIPVAEKDNLYDMTFQKLQELTKRWQELAQLENDILFPSIVEMESILNPIKKHYINHDL